VEEGGDVVTKHIETNLCCSVLDRRGFLRVSTALAALGLAGPGLPAAVARADALTREQRDKMTPDEILAVMKTGNERFRKGERKERNYLAEQRASASGQYPATVILSCIDSRAPAEVIMDLGIGDVFNCRVAGNVVNDDILGSMEFACGVTGSKVAVIMGHTACGAIKGAIDNVELGNLTQLLAKIRPAVAATKFEGERSSKNPAFVDAVAKTNVQLAMKEVLARSSILRDLETQKKIDVVGAMYSIETAQVEFFQ
jgi:carbonic anhydrase